MNSKEIKNAEQNSATEPSVENGVDASADLESNNPGFDNQDFYTAMPTKQKKNSLLGSIGKSNVGKKKLLIGGLGGGLGLLALILLILFLMSLLKIPNYAANIAGYRLARTAIEISRTSAEIDSEKVAMDSADASAIDAFDSTTKGLLGRYRPKTIYKNMMATNRISYDSVDKIKSVFIDGKEINIKQRWGHPWDNYKARTQFAGEIQANVDKALEGYSSIVRGEVAKNIRSALGIELKWWEKLGMNYRGAKTDEADLLAYKERVQKIKTLPDDSSQPLTDELKKGEQDYKTALEECTNKSSCAAKLAKGEIPEELTKTLAESTKKSFTNTAVGIVNPFFDIIVPLCLIYDGSIVRSGGDIDAQDAAATKSFYALVTAADQQKVGDTTTEAVGSFDRLLGQGDSIPDQYMRGNKPDTSLEKSPQSSATGEFTIVSTLLASHPTVAGVVDGLAKNLCPTLSNAKTMGVVGILALIPGTVSGVDFSAESLGQIFKQIVKNLVKNILFGGGEKKIIGGEVVTKLTLKALLKNVWGFSKKFARDFALIEGTTVLSKTIILSKAGMINDGSTSAGADFKNQADMGGDIHNNELNRQGFYGAPMTNKTVAQNDKEITAYLDKQDSNKPVLERYFALSNPRSLMSKFGYKLIYFKKIGLSKLMYKYLAVVNISSISKTLFPMFNNSYALADDGSVNGHYGVVQWGWADEEVNLIKSNRTYGVLENAQILKNSGKEDEIAQKYDSCFKDSVGTLLSGGGDSSKIKLFREENGDIIADKGDCSPNQLGIHNPIYGDLVFRYRLDKKRESVLNQNLAIQNPTEDSQVFANGDFGATGCSETYCTNTSVSLPDADKAMQEAAYAVQQNNNYCNSSNTDSGSCQGMCDHVAGLIWGHRATGYISARVHYEALVAQGKGHPGDKNIPIGALVFFDTSANGHATVYVGGGKIVSTDVNGAGTVSVISIPDLLTKWNTTYLGWSEPNFTTPQDINPWPHQQ